MPVQYRTNMSALRLISIEYDAATLEARNALLRSAGYVVTGASTFYQALEKLQKNRFDLVLFGRNIPGAQLRGFLELVKVKAPVARTMILRGSSQAEDFKTACFHDPEEGPEALLCAVQRLLIKSHAA